MATTDYRWSSRQAGSFRTPNREENLGWWIGAAIIVSAGLHVGLWAAFGRIELEGSGRGNLPTLEEQLKFRLDRQATVKEQQVTQAENRPVEREKPIVDQPPDLTQFKMSVKEELKLTPSVAMPTNIIMSRPMGDIGALGAAAMLSDIPSSLDRSLADQMGAATAQASSDTRISPMQAQINLNDLVGGKMDDSLLKDAVAKTLLKGSGGGGADGFTSLDDLLNYKGPVTEDKKAMMPTDLLFEYGSYELKDTARLSLMMLGFIIQKNKDADISLEGHTDTFGGDDFNQQLSEKRALAVKNWLTESLRLSPDAMKTTGFGKAKPLVAGETPEKQAKNRRVEIVIKPKR